MKPTHRKKSYGSNLRPRSIPIRTGIASTKSHGSNFSPKIARLTPPTKRSTIPLKSSNPMRNRRRRRGEKGTHKQTQHMNRWLARSSRSAPPSFSAIAPAIIRFSPASPRSPGQRGVPGVATCFGAKREKDSMVGFFSPPSSGLRKSTFSSFPLSPQGVAKARGSVEGSQEVRGRWPREPRARSSGG